MNYSNCPRLCSLQLNGLVQGMEQLEWNMGDQFRVITVSIDPNESPERAAATKHRYMDEYGRFGPADGWHFLTGREENIRKLADAIGFAYTYVEETRQYAHAAVTMVCTPGGRVSRYLYGIEYKPQTLRLALVEAGEGKVGSTTDRILLLCATYDAASGSYAAAAGKLMQIGGGLTVLVLGSALLVAWRREAKKKARIHV
jgi:protein SCO1/2